MNQFISFSKTKKGIFLYLIIALLVIRESGLLDLNLYKSQSSSRIEIRNNLKIKATTNIHFVKMAIKPRLLDFVPIYKSRDFEGKVKFPSKSKNALTEVTYIFSIDVYGFCSARKFRQLAAEELNKVIIRSMNES